MSIAHHDDNDDGEGDDDGDDGDEVEKQKNYQMFPLLESSSTEMSTPENSFTLNKWVFFKKIHNIGKWKMLLFKTSSPNLNIAVYFQTNTQQIFLSAAFSDAVIISPTKDLELYVKLLICEVFKELCRNGLGKMNHGL